MADDVHIYKSSRQAEDVGDLTPAQLRRQRQKIDVCSDIIRRMKETGHEAVNDPGFTEDLQAFFSRLPTRYALDVNVKRAEDVLTHKHLLELAEVPENRPVFHVRAVHVLPVGFENERPPSPFSVSSSAEEHLSGNAVRPSVHPPPSFGSSSNLGALALELRKPSLSDEDKDSNDSHSSPKFPHMPMHEVTFSTLDKPKILSQLSTLLADIGLNIREAHVFCTADGYSLDVFVVDGWPTEDTRELQQALEIAVAKTKKRVWSTSPPSASPPSTSPHQPTPDAMSSGVEYLKIPSDGTDDWEIDHNQLKFNRRVASGSFGDLYRGTYCGQDVAIKVLKPERLTDNLQREFAHEVYIMRKVRHKNVVQFIGACTKSPDLCIVTEFMSGGSVYDYLHKHRGVFKLPALLRVAVDVSKGMDYLHQNKIIHRDLKAANLLMDENEVIEHKLYDRKADVFSFGIVLWELLTGKLPYDYLTPLQAAVGVVQKGLRPTIPKSTHPRLAELLQMCWQQDPAQRPDFSDITVILQDILKEVGDEDRKERRSGGFFSALKRTSR
eukprot:c23920_g1_i2 orf=686-2344(-)